MNVDAASTVEVSAPLVTQTTPGAETQAPSTTTEAPAEKPPNAQPDKAATSMRDQITQSLQKVRDRPRDDSGRFAQDKAAAAKPDAAAQAPAAKAVEQPKPGEQAQADTAPAKPPKLERPADMPKAWGADKSALWSALTPEQRAYVADRETQMEGFHAKFGGLAQWHDAAAANGTTLPEVLDRVNKVETAMISDPSAGLVMACQMVGLDQSTAVKALSGALRRLGIQVGPQPQAQPQPGADGQQPGGQTPPVQPQPAQDPRIDAVLQKITAFDRIFSEQNHQKAEQAVREFAANADNKFFNEVAPQVAAELRAMKATGQPLDLQKAYDRALWTRPDIRDKLVAEQVSAKSQAAAAAKTQELEKARNASRSVAGSPPTAEGRSSADKPTALRDEVAMRVRNVAGRA